MREIRDHQTNECNQAISIEADEPDLKYGNASHVYNVLVQRPENEGDQLTQIRFQRGPIKEVGTNGLTNEVLLAIVADRLRGFQSGPFACDENYAALHQVMAALVTLQTRTQRRVARGVEGTNVV